MNLLPRICVLPRIRASVRSAFAVALVCVSAHAAQVTNWVATQAAPVTPVVTSGLETNSPTIGDGTPQNADAVRLYAAFPEITLVNSGDSILLSGSMTLSGITSTAGGTNQQLRFGLFDNLGIAGTDGWLGYFVANSTSANAGVIRQRNAGNVDLYISNTGSTLVASTANPPNSRTGAILTNDTYSFSLQLTRDGSNYDIAAALSGGPGGNFLDSFSINNLAPAATETFTFNTVGFLIGDAMDADQVQYHNVEVTFIPEPGALGLLGIGGLLFLRRRRCEMAKS